VSDERLKTKTEESTCLVYTGLLVELEHRKIKTTILFIYYETTKRKLKTKKLGLFITNR
jgi:hypothetical protein